MKPWLLVGLVVGLVVAAGCATSESQEALSPEISGVNNFHVIEKDMYRSGRPTVAEIEMLAESYNIKTILSLETYALDPQYQKESQEAADDLGIRVVNIPISPVGKLDTKAVKKALAALKVLPRPILVHCYRGAERTGVVVAAYRITASHWTYDQAVAEMDSYGFNPLFNGWKKSLKEVVGLD